jgi:hypothetical protein
VSFEPVDVLRFSQKISRWNRVHKVLGQNPIKRRGIPCNKPLILESDQRLPITVN